MKSGFKVVLIDDEPWIVQSLSVLLDWKKEGFQVAGTYTNPLELLADIQSIEPDLILLDIRMPQMSGEKMMEQIRQNGLDCQFIIISAYGDFTVAQKALSLGVVGYVLKPVSREELQLAVQRAKKKILENLAAEPADPSDQEAILRQTQLDCLVVQDCYVLVSDCADVPPPSSSNGIFSPPVKIYGNRQLWIFVPNSTAELAIEELERYCARYSCAMGCSQRGNLETYTTLYKQAACAYFGVKLRRQKKFAPYRYADADFVRSWSRSLLAAQSRGELCHKLIELTACWEQGANPATIALLVTEISCRILFRQADGESGAVQDLLILQDFFSTFQEFSEIIRYLEEVLIHKNYDAARDMMAASGAGSQIKKYIDSHYADKLSLTEISRRFFLSASYISDAFKKYSGYTVTAYIAKVRMEQAALLLEQTDQNLVQIADQVGYDDYNYFCRLFKKHYQITPNAYRRSKRAGPRG